MQGPTVIKKGVLRKKGKASGKWSQRQFQLSAINLTYSRAFPLGRSKIWAGCWALRDIKEVRTTSRVSTMCVCNIMLSLRYEWRLRAAVCLASSCAKNATDTVCALTPRLKLLNGSRPLKMLCGFASFKISSWRR